jgi:hypothetical protein
VGLERGRSIAIVRPRTKTTGLLLLLVIMIESIQSPTRLVVFLSHESLSLTQLKRKICAAYFSV